MPATEHRAFRRRQKAYLAYYGKQSMTQWADLPVRLLDESYDAVGAQVSLIAEMMKVD